MRSLLHSALTLRVLLPTTLCLTGIANVGLRFLPVDRISFRSWEAVTVFMTGPGPFAVNKHYLNPAAYGDLPSIANLPEYRRLRSESFTTGPSGYRTYDPTRDGEPRILVLGDSFGAGAAVNDSAHLAAQLGRLLRQPAVFAGYSGAAASYFMSKFQPTPVVVLELSERQPAPEPANTGVRGILGSFFPRGSFPFIAARYLRDLFSYSPVEIWSGRLYKSLQNDVILPNTSSGSVARFRTTRGTEMLFLQSEVANYQDPPSVQLDDTLRVARLVRDRGSCLITVLVPDKFAVYRPLLEEAPAADPATASYLDALSAELTRAGIPSLNLQDILRSKAADLIESDQYIYHLDDTHWNDMGVTIAAQELSTWIPQVCPQIVSDP